MNVIQDFWHDNKRYIIVDHEVEFYICEVKAVVVTKEVEI